jgi:putative hydrolase of the HAD superfamily
MKYTGFIFDIGNVLLVWDPPAILRAALPGALVAERERWWRAIFGSPRWLDLDRGAVEEPALVAELAHVLAVPAADVERFLLVGRESLVPFPLGMQLLEELHAAGRRLYCLSNMSHGTYAHLTRKYDFWGRFSGVVTSAAARMNKPDPGIFRHTLDTLGLTAAETVFIDDTAANVEAAQALGITAVLFDGSARCGAEVRRLAGM